MITPLYTTVMIPVRGQVLWRHYSVVVLEFICGRTEVNGEPYPHILKDDDSLLYTSTTWLYDTSKVSE